MKFDTSPPSGAAIATSKVRRYDSELTFKNYNLETMFAGKLHAVLMRPFDKGRDFFDLGLYLDRGVQPNLLFLKNALQQTGWQAAPLDGGSWRSRVGARVRAADWGVVQKDIATFLNSENEPLTKAAMLAKLGLDLES